MKKTLLEIKNLKTYFFTYEGVVKALEDVNITIKEGEIFGLVGETGCGKSVTARSVMRLIDPPGKTVGGEILFEGKNILDLTEEEMQQIRGNKISMIFQDPMASLNPLMKIGRQISEVLEIHNKITDKRELNQRVIEVLRMVRLPSPERIVNQYPFELSGGMRQRVMIAMMLSTEPKLLIADEPTTALDVTIQAQILKILKEMKERMGVSIWLITHDLGVVAETCDRVCVMYAGSIVECGNVTEIFKHPSHPYTKGLLQAIPTVHKKLSKLNTIPGSVPNLITPPPGCRFHPRCSHAMDICSKQRPKSIRIEEEHLVACHLFSKGEIKSAS